MDYMNECKNITVDLNQKAVNIKKEDVMYLLSLHDLELKALKEELLENTERCKKFILALAERVYKKINSMTYATTVHYLLDLFNLEYKTFVGFSCLDTEKSMYAMLNKDLSKHPFPANHIYITLSNGTILECFVKSNKKYYDTIAHIDCCCTETKKGA